LAKRIKESMKKTTADKWKKKVWYKIYAPKEFDLKEIGETVSTKPELLPGRTIKVSLRELTNQIRKHYVKVKFMITEVKGKSAYAEAVGHAINEGFLKKFTRRRSSKMQVVVKGKTVDGADVNIKVVGISARKADKKKRTDIRKAMEEEISAFIKSCRADTIVSEIISDKLAKMILEKAKKIHPMKRVEITKSQVKKQKQEQ
jgi:small subunit ribosomal protein S3Ae